MRSSRTRLPFSDRRVRPQSLVGDVPRALFGTSKTMPKTFLSGKKALPVNFKLLMKPSRSKKKGSLRRPAKNLYSPRVVGLRAERSRCARDHGRPSVVESSSQGAGRQVDGCPLGAPLNIGEPDPERPVGDRIAVRVDVDRVDGLAVEERSQGRRQRVDVQHQDRLAGISRLLERIDVRDV